VRAQQDLVYGIALRSTRDPAAAEDVAQEAFVRAYHALADYDAERIRALQLRAWLARITMNLCRNRARARRSRPAEVRWDASPLAIAPPADPAPRPESVALVRESDAEWGRRLAALPDRYRTAVELRHVHGLSYEECAVALDRPVNTVKTHVHRGVALLRTAVLQEANP
jgi:RNA polymerase sigma-70 factor (ECF subfamily)